ncbi:phage major capsid protein [Cellulosimicrobium funkei]|uniref:phage major capsid protein n=1 Tax=Cellulosimicrobium funkei TaxID=264251 RepID=UPI00367AA637
MASYTYPVKHPEGTLTTDELHLLLSNPRVIAKRLHDLTQMKFIADFLLQGRFNAAGGGVFYETGEDAFTSDDPESIAPLGEYPKVVLETGEVVSARVVKWGLDTVISDEKVARQGISYVNRGLTRLGNTIVRHVDSVAMAVIASRVTSTFASPSTWTTAGKAVEAVLSIQQTRAELGLGLELDTVVLSPTDYAKVIGMLIDDKALPREGGATAVQGNIPVDALGLTWATTPHYTGTNPLLVDREQLGGMADESLGGPGYVGAGTFNVEAKTIRNDDDDSTTLRGRRVTVPVVTEPLAGVQLTNTGL